jgi:hypothetical protein
MVSCISSVIGTIDKLIQEWQNGDMTNLPTLVQAFCSVVACAKTVGLPTDKIPFFNYFSYACTVGQIGAKQIKCRDYSSDFLGIMGLPTACRQSIINGQPIVLEPCAAGNRLTVAACVRDSYGNLVSRPYDAIQRDCVSAVVNPRRNPRIPQLQYGTCARWCIERTSSVTCFSLPPVQQPSQSGQPSYNSGRPSYISGQPSQNSGRPTQFSGQPYRPSFNPFPLRTDIARASKRAEEDQEAESQ